MQRLLRETMRPLATLAQQLQQHSFIRNIRCPALANGRQQRLQTLLQRVFALSVTQSAALIMRLHFSDEGRVGMESIEVRKDNIAFDLARIADPQMGRDTLRRPHDESALRWPRE